MEGELLRMSDRVQSVNDKMDSVLITLNNPQTGYIQRELFTAVRTSLDQQITENRSRIDAVEQHKKEDHTDLWSAVNGLNGRFWTFALAFPAIIAVIVALMTYLHK
jgi:hypothetical protein